MTSLEPDYPQATLVLLHNTSICNLIQTALVVGYHHCPAPQPVNMWFGSIQEGKGRSPIWLQIQSWNPALCPIKLSLSSLSSSCIYFWIGTEFKCKNWWKIRLFQAIMHRLCRDWYPLHVGSWKGFKLICFNWILVWLDKELKIDT